MAGDGFTVSLAAISGLESVFHDAASDLAKACATWQVAADRGVDGLRGVPTDYDGAVLSPAKTRQVLTVAGLETWSAELVAWWRSHATADQATAALLDDITGGAPIAAIPKPTDAAVLHDPDELRR